MYSFLHILSAILTVLAVGAISLKSYRAASIIVVIWNIILFSMMNSIYTILEKGSLLGMFFVLILSMIMSFLFLVLYRVEKEKLLLKLATVSAIFASTNILCIMTFIPSMRTSWWYHSTTFDLFYWNYGELQIVLTIYMITLFGKSGIMGLYNEFNAVRYYIHTMDYMHGMFDPNRRINSGLLVGSNKSNKKGI